MWRGLASPRHPRRIGDPSCSVSKTAPIPKPFAERHATTKSGEHRSANHGQDAGNITLVEHSNAGSNEIGSDRCLKVRKGKNEVRFQGENLGDIRRGEGRDSWLLAPHLRRTYRIARHASAKDRVVSSEAVIAAAPDAILASWCGKKVVAEKIRQRHGWGSIPAVRTNRIVEIKSPLILQPGPAALTDGLNAILSALGRSLASEQGSVTRPATVGNKRCDRCLLNGFPSERINSWIMEFRFVQAPR
jgi:hypothetical protein